jgi:hypothetical protein
MAITLPIDDSQMSEPQLYRLHVRPDGDAEQAFRYCVRESVLGTGWGTTRWADPTLVPSDWDSYLSLAKGTWTDRAFAPVRWLHYAPTGSLVWTRDSHGIYYLARLTGDWEYRDEPENRKLDLNNVRPAELFPVPGAEAAVPGAVVRAFSGRGWAFCRLWDENARRYSAYLYAELGNTAPPSWRPTPAEIVASLLDPLDVEDLVSSYLQARRGLIALPTRHNKSTLAYEYTLRDPSDGQVFAVQVKTGGASVPVESLSSEGGLRWIVFSPTTQYAGTLPPHVETIELEELLHFMASQPHALPPVTSTWLAFTA